MEANYVYWNMPAAPPPFPDSKLTTAHDLDSIVVTEEFPRVNFQSSELPDQQRAFYKTVRQRADGGNLSGKFHLNRSLCEFCVI